MTKNTSFSLGDHFSDFIEMQVAKGRYSNASDVVRAGLRLLEEQEAKLAALRGALVEGETSGASSPFDFDAFRRRQAENQSTLFVTRYILSPRAKADIEDIWDYTAQHWNVQQAENYIRQIQTAIEAVAAEPAIARSCDDVRAGYWKYPAGSHVVFFRKVTDGIDVVRILHRRMDFERHF